MLENTIIVDGRDHLLGRLASVVAKELLSGQKVVIVRCDQVCISGSLVRNKVKYAQFRKKRMNTNPSKGPYHFKSPAKMVWRTIRGMCHQKTARGQEALARLSTFEGIPHPYDKKKRQVIPAALRVMRLKPSRNYTVLGELANAVGWKHQDLLKRLEDKRKVRAAAFYEKKKAKTQLREKAEKAAAGELAKVNEVLEASGY
uniref:60S ribosomal protein L13a n=1 Tax=Helicotheca tamesis TaxID=374047 RepID=A0A7S2DZL3_9STRA|mmetsp:Transcript_11253/g.15594  ORF Transcript_11253/g.15594 Transcript_11253/m.15594 type:complete len:201 (+) Transcript_11253:54-656(+)|eukprot:CAMPEP_0185729254 /NCGR_PEP_ID=MMETSP1171-20130828/4890_1 /TAXON_ID=374046 /ORGANISM="Helicotheca tamensis, Strain CCMP826" /LENGTH=200 /DNA_ID=CAMNT_0028398051 /DNA_START=41 /DNA_END=643 /DNA_ORIENTATION=+